MERAGIPVAPAATEPTMLLRAMVFPLLMAVVIFAAWSSYAPGREAWLTPLIVLPAFAVAMLLERRFPFTSEWNRPWKESRDDGIFFLLTQPFLFMAELAAMTLGTMAAIAISGTVGDALWPSAIPWYLQIALALLVADFAPYWYHRLSHETGGLLWRIHAIHHAPERLYSLNFIRLHPLNTLASKFLGLLPLALLGVPAEVIFIAAIIQKVHSMLSHTNFDFRLGPLNWVFSMAELHRLHHAKEMAVANNNYGGTVIFWDVVFGTRIASTGDKRVPELGIGNPEEVPAGVCRQVCAAIKPH